MYTTSLISVDAQQARAQFHRRVELVQDAMQLLSRLRILDFAQRLCAPVTPNPVLTRPAGNLAIDLLSNRESLESLIDQLEAAMRKSNYLMEQCEEGDSEKTLNAVSALSNKRRREIDAAVSLAH